MIQLAKDLWMDADENQYVVGTPYQTVRRGAQCVKLKSPTYYYPTIALAVRGALGRTMRKAVADGSITTLRQFIQEQERLRGELEKLVAPLDSEKEA